MDIIIRYLTRVNLKTITVTRVLNKCTKIVKYHWQNISNLFNQDNCKVHLFVFWIGGSDFLLFANSEAIGFLPAHWCRKLNFYVQKFTSNNHLAVFFCSAALQYGYTSSLSLILYLMCSRSSTIIRRIEATSRNVRCSTVLQVLLWNPPFPPSWSAIPSRDSGIAWNRKHHQFQPKRTENYNLVNGTCENL